MYLFFIFTLMELMNILDDMGVSKFLGNVHFGSEILF